MFCSNEPRRSGRAAERQKDRFARFVAQEIPALTAEWKIREVKPSLVVLHRTTAMILRRGDRALGSGSVWRVTISLILAHRTRLSKEELRISVRYTTVVHKRARFRDNRGTEITCVHSKGFKRRLSRPTLKLLSQRGVRPCFAPERFSYQKLSFPGRWR